MYKGFVIVFGVFGSIYWNSIWVLNLKGKDGWNRMDHIQCPIKGQFHVVLTGDNHVHLFAAITNRAKGKESQTGHWSIPVAPILGSRFTALKD